jgi:hypothetical protein
MLQLIAVAVNRGTTRDIARRGARANIGAMIFVNYDAVSCSCTRETPAGTDSPPALSRRQIRVAVGLVCAVRRAD